MTALTVTLPYPHGDLTPNGRSHWRKVAALRQQAKRDGYSLTVAELGNRTLPFRTNDSVRALVTFCPPTKRRRDLDNVFSGTKAYMDGVCEALGVDDSRITLAVLQWGKEKTGGEVVVTLEAE